MSFETSLTVRPLAVLVAAGLFALIASPPGARAAGPLDGGPDAAPESKPAEPGYLGAVEQKLAEWEVFVAAGGMFAPVYEGSDEYQFVPLPMISATFYDRVTVDPGGLSVDVYKSNGFKFVVKGGYDIGGGRDEDDSKHLKGLGDIDAGALFGAQVAYEAGPFEFYANLDKSVGGSDGMEGVLGANINYNDERFMLSAGASATFADKNYMEAYFGVTAAQSARSGLAQYSACAGLKRYDIEASITYLVTEHWMLRGQAGVGFLTGDAKDSPIVREDMQPSAMLMLGYKF